MKIGKEEIDFINKIIAKATNKVQLETNLNVYVKYLVLTEKYDIEDVEFVTNAITMADKIFEMKDTFGSFDIQGLMKKEKKENIKKKEKKPEETRIIEKHYNHYVSDSSSSCGGSSSSYRSC